MADLVRVVGRTIEGFDRFPSKYEAFRKPVQIANQHFIFNFSGAALDTNVWTLTDISGTGTTSMRDAINGGVRVTTESAASAISEIDFNSINHYSNTGCVFIWVARRVDTNTFSRFGLCVTNLDTVNNIHFEADTTQSFMRTATSDASTENIVNTDLSTAGIHKLSAELFPSSAQLFIDGILKTTHTTNLPTAALQPAMLVGNHITAAKNSEARYFEVYNT